ncbi:MAG: energy transducer TonB [Candidatus Auribacter fodinae]|jgi:protein TonB|uniref:Energy transducer TonB n=1 Tax=Candidatus Auribacter fodinae TaxID=2093366 RepID=A0A3A4QTN3_9BACT|nr:MAG: energy transducer TonB [Candidatus Auribacter fodinae]
MLFFLKQYRMYLAPFAISCTVHYGVMTMGSGFNSAPADIHLDHGNSALSIKLVQSAPSATAHKGSIEEKTLDNPQDIERAQANAAHAEQHTDITASATAAEEKAEPAANQKAHLALAADMMSAVSFPFIRQVKQDSPLLTESREEPNNDTSALPKNVTDTITDTPEKAVAGHNGEPEDIQPAAQSGGDAPVESVASPDQQDADLREEGAVSEAKLSSQLHPRYPRGSRRKGEQGAVTLNIHVTADGSAQKITILNSSGYQRLDNAAVEAIENAVFSPHTLNGIARASNITLTIRFQLDDPR